LTQAGRNTVGFLAYDPTINEGPLQPWLLSLREGENVCVGANKETPAYTQIVVMLAPYITRWALSAGRVWPSCSYTSTYHFTASFIVRATGRLYL